MYTKNEMDIALGGKISYEQGKGLSSNDYTNEEKTEVAKIANKVDKITGKGLSTNDYTTAEKSKLASLSNYDDTGLRTLIGNTYTKTEVDAKIDEAAIGNSVDLTNYYTKSETDSKISSKVDKVTGKELSSNDFTDELKIKLDGLSNYNDSSIITTLGTKVDKIAGKQLSTEDYTSAEKIKLNGLSNYDDSQIKLSLEGKAEKIDVYNKSELDTKLANKVDRIVGKNLSTNDFTNEYKQKLDELSQPTEEKEYYIEFPESWMAKETLTSEEIIAKYGSYDEIYNYFSKIKDSVGVCIKASDPSAGTITSLTHNFIDDPGDSTIILDEPGFVVAFSFFLNTTIRVQMIAVPRSLDNLKISIAAMENTFVTAYDLSSYVTNTFLNQKLEEATKNIKMYPVPPEILKLSSPPSKNELNSMFSKYSEYTSFKSFIDKVSDGKPLFIDYKQRSIPWYTGYICGFKANSSTFTIYVNYGENIEKISITYDNPTTLSVIGYSRMVSTVNWEGGIVDDPTA